MPPEKNKTNKKFFLIFVRGGTIFDLKLENGSVSCFYYSGRLAPQRTAVQLTWRLLIALHHFLSFFIYEEIYL